jgi:hypothetical protein
MWEPWQAKSGCKYPLYSTVLPLTSMSFGESVILIIRHEMNFIMDRGPFALLQISPTIIIHSFGLIQLSIGHPRMIPTAGG